LKTLKGISTRPTSDRVKEALFNIISGYVEDADVLDLYAGTGSLAIEALSRGARSAVLIDRSKESCNVIRDNLINTRLAGRAQVLNGEVLKLLHLLCNQGKKVDIIFMDPPYRKNYIKDTLQMVSDSDIIKNDGLVVAERDVQDIIPESQGKLMRWRDAIYGSTVLSFYRVQV